MADTFLIHTDDHGNLVFLYDDALKFLFEEGEATTGPHNAWIEPTVDNRWTVDFAPMAWR